MHLWLWRYRGWNNMSLTACWEMFKSVHVVLVRISMWLGDQGQICMIPRHWIISPSEYHYFDKYLWSGPDEDFKVNVWLDVGLFTFASSLRIGHWNCRTRIHYSWSEFFKNQNNKIILQILNLCEELASIPYISPHHKIPFTFTLAKTLHIVFLIEFDVYTADQLIMVTYATLHCCSLSGALFCGVARSSYMPCKVSVMSRSRDLTLPCSLHNMSCPQSHVITWHCICYYSSLCPVQFNSIQFSSIHFS